MRSGAVGLLLVLVLTTMSGCAAGPPLPELDVMEVMLPVSAQEVKTAVTEVLTQGGYRVSEDDDGSLTTGMRQETGSPWDGLLLWRFGVTKSRVEARVIPQDDGATRLRLQVFHRQKDGILDTWEWAETPLPQSAENEIRLIKNALRLL